MPPVLHRLPFVCTAIAGSAVAGGSPGSGLEIIREANTRPDRGDTEAYAYVTGPKCHIHRFYNEDLEVSFWNGPLQMTFSLAKNDVWDRRYFADRKDPITLEDVRRVCFEGEIGRSSDLGLPDAPHALYRAYDFPCPKPVGQLIIDCPDLAGESEWRAGTGPRGTLVAEAASGPARAQLRAFLHRTGNLLVIQGDYSGLTHPLQVQLYRHQDTTPQGTSVAAIANYGGQTGYDHTQDPDNGPLPAPEAGSDGRFFWIRQAFPAEKTFPDGFEYVMMGAIDGPAYDTTAADAVAGRGAKALIHPIEEGAYRQMAGWLKEVRIAAERVNNAESGSLATASMEGPEANFTLFLTVVTTRDARDPLAAARRQLERALRRGAEAVALDSLGATDDDVRKWRLSRVMHYNATSCTYADSTPWHGDYHFNEGYFLPAIVSGDIDGLQQRLRMFEEMVPALRRNAREVYGCSGIAFPLVHYPIEPDRVVYANVTWEWGIENTAFMLQPFWQIYRYTQDLGFLRNRAYPMMAEGARFYADYVTRGDDGLYHVIPTVSQEHWGFTPKWELNRDSVGALSFVKYHLKACIEASEVLGVDADEREKWREIVQNLAPYPTLEADEGPVFCDVRDAPRLLNYNITANLVMVLWAEDISLDSPSELLEMAHRSYRAIPDKEHSPRKGYLQQIEMYLGILEKPRLTPQGRVLSWPGRIHLYAGVPGDVPVNDNFTGLLAVGGFEVSASRSGTEVRGVRIKSRAGRQCRVKSPWHPGEVKVMDLGNRDLIPHTMDGDTIVFDTEAGHTYALLAGPELALAGKRYVAEQEVIGRWTFDAQEAGFVRDASGHGRDAQLVAGAGLAAADVGKALSLAGHAAHARTERTPAFDFAADQSFAVEARIRLPAQAPPRMVPIVCSMASKQYCLTVSDGRARFYLSSPRGDVFCHATGETMLADGRWHTIRGVRSVADGTVCVYVDGKLEAMAADTTQGDFASDAPITIGAYLWGEHTRYAEGLIDDVAIQSLGRLAGRD
jgi:hypothetical protein